MELRSKISDFLEQSKEEKIASEKTGSFIGRFLIVIGAVVIGYNLESVAHTNIGLGIMLFGLFAWAEAKLDKLERKVAEE